MKNYPKISVITPSLNKCGYLGQAIESVMGQDYPNFEHIVADGGSTDGTIELLKTYPHVKWISAPDNGQSDAMNKGFMMSDGEIITYLNADDYFEPRAFNAVIRYFQEGEKFVMGRVRVINDDGSSWINDPSVVFSEMIQWWRPAIFCFNPTGYFYLREVQETIGPFDVENHYTMDYDFLLKSSLRYRLKKIDAVLGAYRHIRDTKSRDYPLSDNWRNPFIFSKKYWRYLPVPEIPYVAAMYYYIIYVKENRNLRDLGRAIDGIKHRLIRKSQDALVLLKLWRAGRVAIFGASKTGGEFLQVCRRMGIKVEYFIDNNPALQGKQFMGVPVYFPSHLLEDGRGGGKNTAVLIASQGRRDEMRRLLKELNFTGEII
ncbi:glycosyltransferase [Candidatus Magnetominusculus dajiuhuensis]|uniref:glycosyltransferase n=1 Tax=Candidatus Magnetominusculus dajiuhuensis TaxID=3137712 RepID=UPI003B432478